jgi:hypothetical protein
MMRPLFLSNITRTPSFKWLLRKLVNRIMRQLRGIERPAIKTPTEREFYEADLAIAFTAGAGVMGIVTMLLIAFAFGR